MDDITIETRPFAGKAAVGHTVWLEVGLSTPATGVFAVFQPPAEEIQAGEADLAAEHLMRRAQALRNDLVRLRSAFRSARGKPGRPTVLWPLLARRTIEGGSIVYEPSLERAAFITVVAMAIGIIGSVASSSGGGLAVFTAGVSGILIAYALIGSMAASRLEREFDRTAGLHVPILPAGSGAVSVGPAARFEGPYVVEPRIIIAGQSPEFTVRMEVCVVDNRGQLVDVLSAEATRSDDPEVEAAVLIKQADQLVEELEVSEAIARGILPRPVDDTASENGV